MRTILLSLTLATAAAAQPAVVFDFSGLAPAYGVAETVAFQAVNVVPLAVTFCGSVIQRERPDGGWADADTLTCDVPPPDEGTLAAVGRARHNVRLQPGYFRSMLAAGGPGRFRVVLGASDADGLALPESARASPPFYMDGPTPEALARVDPAAIGRLPAEAHALYEALPGFRAIAVGTGAGGQTVWGYASRNRTADGAAYRALSECSARAIRSAAPCVLAAVDGPAAE